MIIGARKRLDVGDGAYAVVRDPSAKELSDILSRQHVTKGKRVRVDHLALASFGRRILVDMEGLTLPSGIQVNKGLEITPEVNAELANCGLDEAETWKDIVPVNVLSAIGMRVANVDADPVDDDSGN